MACLDELSGGWFQVLQICGNVHGGIRKKRFFLQPIPNHSQPPHGAKRWYLWRPGEGICAGSASNSVQQAASSLYPITYLLRFPILSQLSPFYSPPIRDRLLRQHRLREKPPRVHSFQLPGSRGVGADVGFGGFVPQKDGRLIRAV